jgi:chromate transporter
MKVQEQENKSAEQPTALKLFKIWLLIGAQSFGGGSMTWQLIRQEMVVKRGWIGELEYIHINTLATLVPGINLIAVAIQIGRKLAGWRGIAATVTGMLLPSAIITALLTIGFSLVENSQPVKAMLGGIVPATNALLFLIFVQFSVPLLRQSAREGRLSVGLAMGLTVLAFGLSYWLQMPVAFVLLISALTGALVFPIVAKSQTKAAEGEQP